MITIIFKDGVKENYGDYVKYFYETVGNYFELFPNTEMQMNNITKEKFDYVLDIYIRNICHYEYKPEPSTKIKNRDVRRINDFLGPKYFEDIADLLMRSEKYDRLTLLAQLLEDHSYMICDASGICVKIGDVDCLRYVRENDYGCWNYINKDTCEYALSHGYLDCLKYLNDINLLSITCGDTVVANKPEWIECLHKIGVDWLGGETRYAISHGYLECLKCLHENGCPWDKDACNNAARLGYLDCIKYAYENGYEWNGKECYYAEYGEQYECLEYMRTNGCEYNQYDFYTYQKEIRENLYD